MASRITPTGTDVLLVIDVQNDFCKGGSLEVPRGDEVVSVINNVSSRFQHAIVTQDWHPDGHTSFASQHAGAEPFQTIDLDYGEQVLWPDHCIQHSAGADFHDKLAVANCELIIRKGYRRTIDSYSAFFENDRQTSTGLTGYLRERGLNRLFVTGLATDYCVRYSAVDGRAQGFDVVLLEDACRGIDNNGSMADAMREMAEVGVELADSNKVA